MEELERRRGGSRLPYSFDIAVGADTHEVGIDGTKGITLRNTAGVQVSRPIQGATSMRIETPPRHVRVVICVVLAAAAIVAAPQTATQAAAQETAVAPERNPPGDIPDDQVFVAYVSPRGFTLKVPEGWSRRERADGVSFEDKYGSVDVTISAGTPPTVEGVRATEVPALEGRSHALKLGRVWGATLPAGSAVRISYTANSEPNPVTGKRIRLECERTLIPHAGQVAALTFAAPAGADNADQWRLMANSFRWN